MSDELPDLNSTWFVGGADSEFCVLDGNNLACDFGTIASGDGRSVTVTGYHLERCGELPNTATVASADDGDASNDESTAVAQLQPCEEPEPEPQGADVEALKEVTEQDEETVTFTLSVANHGPDVAYGDGVYLNDTLPAVEGPWFLGGPDSDACHFMDDTLVCHWDEVPANETRSVTATAYIIGMCGDFANTATVWAVNDNSPDNNEATAVADLGPCADAAVSKDATQDANSVTFTLGVESIGEDSVTNVTLFDDLPDLNRTWFLGGADSEFCTLDGNALECAFGDLAPGESRSVTVKAYTDQMACDSELENVAWISAGNDGDASNDQDSAFVRGPACS